ncbi:hypothetical protein CSB11_00915 [Candidatus Campbellbacteria bacterium]|nr:MAG: hypothetical protein CSB11_00915 [Candidatus Campbellbacteria bacterium]
MSQNNVELLTKKFLEYIEIEKGRSLNTVSNYKRYLKKFFDYTQIQDVKDINQENVSDFRIYLNRQNNGKKGIENSTLSKKTQNYYLTALKMFLQFLSKRDIKSLASEKIELAKISQRELDLVSEKEFTKFLNADDTRISKQEQAKEKAIVELLYSTGLRVSELCNLNIDIDMSDNQFSVRGKGGKIRLVFLSQRAKDFLKKYLDLRNDKKDSLSEKYLNEALFVTNAGNRIYPRYVQRLIKKRSTIAGVSKKITPHTIRHFFATDLLKNGADIRSVQMLLGHSSISTTQVYTNVSDKYLKDIHQKFHKN